MMNKTHTGEAIASELVSSFEKMEIVGKIGSCNKPFNEAFEYPDIFQVLRTMDRITLPPISG